MMLGILSVIFGAVVYNNTGKQFKTHAERLAAMGGTPSPPAAGGPKADGRDPSGEPR